MFSTFRLKRWFKHDGNRRWLATGPDAAFQLAENKCFLCGRFRVPADPAPLWDNSRNDLCEITQFGAET